jgi:hypothetical protein
MAMMTTITVTRPARQTTKRVRNTTTVATSSRDPATAMTTTTMVTRLARRTMKRVRNAKATATSSRDPATAMITPAAMPSVAQWSSFLLRSSVRSWAGFDR